MYGRVTRFQMDPKRAAEVVALLDGVSSRIKAIPGVISAYTCWRSEDGHGVTAAIYESHAAADAAAPEVQRILTELGPFMTVPPSPEVFENVRNLLA